MSKEVIYIAGPECFYTGGSEQLDAMRRRAESLGFDVSLPNDNPLKLDYEDLRLNADAIFRNCADSMDRSTAIIADLEFFRGPEVDAGTVYEIGMAYARGIRCYGYTRDKRSTVWKYYDHIIKDGQVYDKKGRLLPYRDLPFSPNLVASTKIVQGDFDDCLQTMIVDIEEERKFAGKSNTDVKQKPGRTLEAQTGPVVFIAGPERYEPDYVQRYITMKKICRKYGMHAVVPTDDVPGLKRIISDDPYTRAYNTFEHNQQHVRNCDVIIANLNFFHNREPESDTAFECGMAFQLGKKLFAYVDDARNMKELVPNFGEKMGYRDACGCNVEDFNYPLNLMFSSSMTILEGQFEDIIGDVAKTLFLD